MGMFSYECKHCGKREQFDWISDIMFFYDGEYRFGEYSGYGYVKYDNKKIYSLEFEEFFECWGDVEYTTPEFICAPCYDIQNNYDSIDDVIYQVRRYKHITEFEEEELIEKKDFKIRKEAREYYDSFGIEGRALTYYNKKEGDDDYEMIDNISLLDNEIEWITLDKLLVKDLKSMCKLHKIKGYSKLKKQQLLDLLREHEYFKDIFMEESKEEQEEGNKCDICEKIKNNLKECENECACGCMACEDCGCINEDGQFFCDEDCRRGYEGDLEGHLQADLDAKIEYIHSLKVKELKSLCKKHELKGYSKLKKEELIDLVSCAMDSIEIPKKEAEESKEEPEEDTLTFREAIDAGWYREMIACKNNNKRDQEAFLKAARDFQAHYLREKDTLYTSKRHQAHWFYAVFVLKPLREIEELPEEICKKCGDKEDEIVMGLCEKCEIQKQVEEIYGECYKCNKQESKDDLECFDGLCEKCNEQKISDEKYDEIQEWSKM